MLNKLRNFSKGKLAGVLVGIIIIPFVFWGMGSVFSGGNKNSIAKINNHNVSTQDFSDFINNIITDNSLELSLNIISYAILPLVILIIISAYFQAIKKTTLFILFQTVLINLVFLILLFIYEFQNYEVNSFLLYTYAICIVLVLSILTIFYIKPKGNQNNSLNKTKFGYKNIIKTSTPMMLSGSLALLMGWSDILMLSYYKTSIDVGIYNAALKIAAISGITLIAVNAIATPKFVEFYAKNDFLGLKKMVQNSTKLIFFTTTPILFILICFPQSILGFLGDEFSVAYIALIYLCVSRFVNAISGSVGYIMQMTDQQVTYQNVIFIAVIINVALNFLLIPSYGYTGAALASSIAMIFWNLTLVLIIKKKLGFWTIYVPFIINSKK